jgi:DNA-binding NtrC family response regulator/tetratricopeptide (TPR) repeat protein
MPDEKLSSKEPDPQAVLTERIRDEADPGRRAELQFELAQSLLRANPPEAKVNANQALELARANNRPSVAARALALIAEANFITGNYPEVAGPCQEGLDLAVQCHDAYAEHKAANILGLALQQGDRDRAVRLFEQSLAAAQKLNDDQAVARVYNNLGILNRERGDMAKALEYHFKALELNERRKDSHWVGISHLNIGVAYGDLGDWEKAIEYFYRALIESEKQGDKRGMAICYLNVAEIYLTRGKYERAVHSADLSVKLATEARAPLYQLAASTVLGQASALSGDHVRARSIFDLNIRTAQELGLPREQAGNLTRKADLLLGNQETSEAIALLDSALAILGAGGAPLSRAGVLGVLGNAYAQAGNPAKAEEFFRTAVAILETAGKRFDLAKVHFDLGRFLVNTDRRQEGLALVQEAAKTFKRLEVINESEEAERYLFQVDVEQDRRLSLLRSLSALAVHSLPLSEFAPRCLDTLKAALGFSNGSFLVEEGRQFLFGQTCNESELERCRKGEIVMTGDCLCLPLRLSGRNVGGIYLRWADPVPGIGGSGLGFGGLDASYFEIVSNLLSVAMERNRTQQGVALAETAPEETKAALQAPRYPGFIGNSKPLLAIYETIEQVAPTNACVLILGETGTGKELIARIVAQRSPRCNESFVAFNCAAIPETLVESELFGIEKGVATGVTERRGKFEQANRGTLFLDEIGDLSPVVQAKLLRVLQDRQIERVGGRKTIEVDTRIIAATNRNIEQAIAEGKFRSDLYYRLNVVTLGLPSLRERREDIPLLINHFVEKYNEEFQRRIRGVVADVLDALLTYAWPGNVRELENVIERAVILCRTDLIQITDLPPGFQPKKTGETTAGPGTVRVDRKKAQDEANAVVEKNLILTALKENDWSAAKAARQVGISRSHFYRLLEKYDLKRPEDAEPAKPGN